MAKKKLTQKTIENAKTDKESIIIWDEYFKSGGFGIRVHKSGLKKYLINYRDASGIQRRKVIADANLVSLADARNKARKLFLEISNGTDPLNQKKRVDDEYSFAALSEIYINDYALVEKRPRSIHEDKRIIKIELLPILGDLKLSEISTPSVKAILENIYKNRGKPVMAQRTKALLSKIFNFAIDRQICSSNPVTNSIKIKANPSKDRFLSESEIKVLAKRLFASKMPSARLLLLILLTGQRPGEVAGMRWSELDQGIWNLPGARTKNKKSTVIPLSDLAQEIIAEQRKLVQILAESELSEDKSRFEIFVFPMIRPSKVTEDEHMAWFSSGTRRILTETKLAKFTPHDLRRTCATTVRQLGCSRDVVRSLLNHSNRSDVTAIYDRYDELEGKREALQKLADLVRRFRDDDCSDHPVTSNLYFLSKQAA